MIDEPLESNRSGNEQKFSEHLINSGWSHTERDTLLSQLLPVIFQFTLRESQTDWLQLSGWWGLGFQAGFTKSWHLPWAWEGGRSAEMGQVTATGLVRGRQRSGSPAPKMGWNGQAGGVWGRWWRKCHTFSTHGWTHVETNTETQTHTRTHGDMKTDTQEHSTRKHRDTKWDSNPGPSESKAQPLSAALSKALEMKGHTSCALKSFSGLHYSK